MSGNALRKNATTLAEDLERLRRCHELAKGDEFAVLDDAAVLLRDQRRNIVELTESALRFFRLWIEALDPEQRQLMLDELNEHGDLDRLREHLSPRTKSTR